jgi:membrane-associated phospholipid phosphatase
MDALWAGGIEVIKALQHLGNWLALPMQALTILGLPGFYIVLIPVTYWCLDNRLGSRLGVFLMGSIWLNEIAKVTLHEPRPFWLQPGIETWGADGTFGLPSGHAQHAVVMWGLLAATARRPLAWPAACVLSLLIGVSRVYLGVHFPTDVLAGWIIGAAILWTLLRLEHRSNRWFVAQARVVPIALTFFGTLTMVALAILTALALRGWQMPPVWLRNAQLVVANPFDPTRLDFAVISAGILCGMLVGACAVADGGGQPTHSTVVQRLASLPVGLALAGAIWVLVGFLTPQMSPPGFYGPLWLRAVLIGLWVSAGAPCLFRRLRLSPADRNIP